jgi:hypothetical protein
MPTITANSSQLVYGSKVYEVLQYYYAPAANNLTGVGLQNTLYGFIGQVDPWEDEYNPPTPTQDQYSIKNVYKNIIATKRITSSDISAVIPRFDWTEGTVYDIYDDKTDMFTVDENGILNKIFYIKNRFDQVFKCLWNANGSPSTIEPEFLPGTFDKTLLIKTADGYKWKFLYSINPGVKQKFLDANWMPVPAGQTVPNPVQTYAAQGSIDVINVLDSGEGYTSGGVTITISGDGQSANAVPTVNTEGYITDIVVANTGQGYTFATTTLNILEGYSTPTKDAVLSIPVSPIGGHGLDPISELGCSHVMIALDFAQSEGGLIPTDIAYRQLGLVLDAFSVSNALSDSNNPYATDSVYDVTTHLFVSPGLGAYSSGQVIYQGPNINEATYTAKIVNFDPATNVVRVINTLGTPALNQAIIQDANASVSSAVRTLLTTTDPDFMIYSGYMTYIENRTGVQRSADATEQFRIVLRF